MSQQFIHLNVHSEYSIADSTIKINDLIKRCSQLQLGAVALTDSMNIFGAIKFFKHSRKKGIFPILGSDVRLKIGDKRIVNMTLLCKNLRGYNALCSLLTSAYICDGDDYGIVAFDAFNEVSDNLVCVYNDQHDIQYDREKDFSTLTTHLGDSLFVGFPPIENSLDTNYHYNLFQLSEKHSLPLVALNNVRFLQESDYQSHGVKICIQHSKQFREYQKNPTYHQSSYLKSNEEMRELYSSFPECITNAIMISRLCNLSVLEEKNAQMPVLQIENNIPAEEYLLQSAQKGLQDYIAQHPELDTALYEQRLEYELSIINKFGFAGYFLIVQEFIIWAKENQITTGPGRGSGVGSLVAFCIGITMLDPIHHQLLFERFLNPERRSLPDFDIDFCMKKRDQVIEHLFHNYGKEATAQIITFGTMAAKGVFRDVGRVLGYAYNFVDRIACLIPFELNITLKEAKNKSLDFANSINQSTEAETIYNYALQLEGLVRNTGRHAGGVVVAPKAITHYTSLYRDPRVQHSVTHFDKKDLEYIGLIKFDILGISMLTTIDATLKSIKDNHTIAIELDSIPLDDIRVYTMLCEGKSLGVFQLEGKGITQTLKKLQPSTFDDLIALNALYRPGPLKSGMVDDYIDRKNNIQETIYLHPSLEEFFSSTYGVIVYQEQVLRLAKELASFSQGESEQLRVAITKKQDKLLSQLKPKFINNVANKINSRNKAEQIYNDIYEFTAYSFNRSHSAAYALLSYQTAWLKTHYRLEFIASYLTIEMGDLDKLAMIITSDELNDVNFVPPDINRSNYEFSILSEDTIMYSFGALKGVGEHVCKQIVEERDKNGAFIGFVDFIDRVNGSNVNQRAIESLIHAGCFDSLGYDRKTLINKISDYLKNSISQRQFNPGQQSFFSENFTTYSEKDLKQESPYSIKDKSQDEFNVYGFYFITHPLHEYSELQKTLDLLTFQNFQNNNSRQQYLCIINEISTFNSGRGERYRMTIDDGNGRLELTAPRSVFADHIPNELVNQPMVMQLYVDTRRGKTWIQVNKALLLDEYIHAIKDIQLFINYHPSSFTDNLEELSQTVSLLKNGRTLLTVQVDDAIKRYHFKISKSVEVTPDLLQSLHAFEPKYHV